MQIFTLLEWYLYGIFVLALIAAIIGTGIAAIVAVQLFTEDK